MGIMNSGVKQWIFQRVTNALIVTFGISLLCIFLSEDGLGYESLKNLITNSGFTYYFALVLVLSCINSVLAGWQIDGDYSKKFSLPANSLTLIALVVSVVYLIYGLKLLFT